MKLLALLHRWTGGLVGLLLAVVALSGTVLLWEDNWILLDGANEAPASSPAELGRAIERAIGTAPGLSRITFANDEIGLHQAMYADGSGAYIAQDGSIAARWSSIWERPELWLFDLHHYLLLGETGKTVTGLLGILLLAFTLSGLVLWWRTRKTFRFRLLPARYTASAIVRHHRDLGVVASPLLILVAVTGTLMVFPALSSALLSPFAQPRAEPSLPGDLPPADKNTDWQRIMVNAQATYPDAQARRLTMPALAGEPISIRFRQNFEWTPNGRSYVWLAPGTHEVVAKDDPANGDLASATVEKFYPVHAAKVGGLVWRVVMTFAGIALILLGLLASWSFWTTKIGARQPANAAPVGSKASG